MPSARPDFMTGEGARALAGIEGRVVMKGFTGRRRNQPLFSGEIGVIERLDFRRTCLRGFVAAYSILATLAWSADDNFKFHDQQLRRQQMSDSERQRRFLDNSDSLAPDAEPLAESDDGVDSTCFPANEIEFELVPGSQAPADWQEEHAWLREIIDPFVGACLGQNGLNRLIRRLTDAAIARGRTTTRFTLPPQNFSTGLLRIAVAPGMVGAIRVTDPEYGGSWKSALALRPGDYFDLRAVEQAVEQFGRLSSLEAGFDVLPGSEPGQSEILIKRQWGRPWRGFATVDDSGVKATGRYNAAASISVDDLLGLNDVVSVTVGSGTLIAGLGQYSRNTSLACSVPDGFSTYSLFTNTSEYRQTVQGAFQKFVRSGQMRSTDLQLTRIFWRTQSSRTGINLGITRKHSSQFVDDVEIDVQRRNTTSIQVGIAHRKYLGKAVIEASLTRRRGGKWLGADADAEGLPPGSPTTQYRMTLADALITVPIDLAALPLQYRGSLHAQRTDDLVLGTEFTSIGGRQTVRGFDGEHSLAAERGWFSRNELSARPSGGWPEIYCALDVGKVAGPGTALLAGTKLAGAALGARVAHGRFSGELFVGWPIRQPPGFNAAKVTTGFQLAASF